MATILVVEDRTTDRKLLVIVLKHGGHSVLGAADGAEALHLVRTEPRMERHSGLYASL